ncbi:TonB-dependent receptor [hydrothermal vent metagenome]|uniref:TonB-dependent receptor n=1 Tax=hydrothermal vent metagenome TaxID=652676 RepID=A0A3B0TW93_9ZZZZ
MLQNICYTLICLLITQNVFAQNITGKVTDGNNEPLTGASVYWLHTTTGTVTDTKGEFEIALPGDKSSRIVVSYVGYKPDTINISNQKYIAVKLVRDMNLKEVVVEGERAGVSISKINPVKTEVITQVELTKAACCDLAGCFDTEGSVQATTTNVITNSKELRIMGLAGIYTQVLIDGMPLIQGLSYTYGISSYPGTLVNRINVAMGISSVLQGFESINGQINIELKEPGNSEKLLLNLYVNSFMEKQFNANYSHKFKKWSTLFAAHTTQPANKFDRDNDTFLDLPLLTRYSFYNKWKYGNENSWGLNSLIGLRYVNEQRIGGQITFNPSSDEGTTNSYGQTLKYSQPEIYTKTGYRFNSKKSIVLSSSAFYQNQNSTFGTTVYKAGQLSFYTNLQYELKWGKKHLLKTGFSYRYQNREENISFGQNTLGRTYNGKYIKNEIIPGIFAENRFNWKGDKIVLITGLRLDKHNTFGYFVTPRALLKYELAENTTARVSAGTGYKTINLFSENINLLASSRDIIITEQLRPETAFNWGVNLTHNKYWENVTATYGLDFYRTQFTNQIFPDYDTDPTKAIISNFTGTSISNGFQAETNLKFYDVFEFKISYNYLDVYQVINNSKYVLPFNPKHKIISTLSYKPQSKKWHYDMNIHWFGEQRLANTHSNPPEYRTPGKSKPYTLVSAQFTKAWERFEVYLGCENIFDFRQLRPIISWQDPFGPYFDTSNVWGPTRGRELYLGLRFKIK